MEEVTEADVLNNFKFWARANLISEISKKSTLNQIARAIGDSKSNLYFHYLMKFLEVNGFVTVDRSRTPHIYVVKGKELAWFLRENSKVFEHFELNTKVRMGLKPYYYG